MRQWEYTSKVVEVREEGEGNNARKICKIMNEMGTEGWEAVSIQKSQFYYNYILYFKRPLQAESSARPFRQPGRE